MSWVKIDEGIYAEEVDNPIQVVSIAEIQSEIDSLQASIDGLSDLPYPTGADDKTKEAINAYNESLAKQRRELMNIKQNRIILLEELSVL